MMISTHKTVLNLAVGLLLMVNSAVASLVVSAPISSTGTTPNYGVGNFISGVNVAVGDILVVAHANNKRDNGTNNISLLLSSAVGTSSAVHSGDTGGQASAWVFYVPITTAGTIDIGFDTSNATKTVSQSSTAWVVKPNLGNTLLLTDDAFAATAAATSLNLDFTFTSPILGGVGFAAAAVNTSTLSTVTSTPSWTQVANGADKRRTYSSAGISGSTFSSTFNVLASDRIGLAGVVINAIPEASQLITLSLLSAGGLAWAFRKR